MSDLSHFEDGGPVGDGGRVDDTELRRLIAAAGDYVVPSDDLRPRVLEAARGSIDRRNTAGLLIGFLAAACLGLVLGMAIVDSPRTASEGERRRADTLSYRATSFQVTSGAGGPDWALVEWTQRWREDLASRLSDRSVDDGGER